MFTCRSDVDLLTCNASERCSKDFFATEKKQVSIQTTKATTAFLHETTVCKKKCPLPVINK